MSLSLPQSTKYGPYKMGLTIMCTCFIGIILYVGPDCCVALEGDLGLITGYL